MTAIKRHGPKIRVVYDCDGCAFFVRRDEDEENFVRYLCMEPSVVEECGVPQCFGGNHAPTKTPNWCPFLGKDKD